MIAALITGMNPDDSEPSNDETESPENPPTHVDPSSTAADPASSSDHSTSVDEPVTSESSEDSSPSTEESGSSQSIEDMLLEFDEQEGLIRDRSLLDPNHVVEEDRIVGRDEQLQ